jgi:ubiquitin related modifier 1
MELLFGNKRSHTVSLPSQKDPAPHNVTYLIQWLKENLLEERPELFVEGDTVYVAPWFRTKWFITL